MVPRLAPASLLTAIAGLIGSASAAGFVHSPRRPFPTCRPSRPAANRQLRIIGRRDAAKDTTSQTKDANEARHDADDDDSVFLSLAAVEGVAVDGEDGNIENEDGIDNAKVTAGMVGISGLAAGGATVASTVVTTAGGVCAGGACVAGGAAATAGGSGAAATATAAAAGGGFLAGAKALFLGGALASGVALNGLLGGGGGGGGDPYPPPTLEDMIRASTPLQVLVTEGGRHRPTVMEFYGNACPHCHDAAKSLRSVEETAMGRDGFNWVMVDTDDPRMETLWRAYRVDELPHFEFFDAEGREVGYEFGEVEKSRIEKRIVQAAANAPYQLGGGSGGALVVAQ